MVSPVNNPQTSTALNQAQRPTRGEPTPRQINPADSAALRELSNSIFGALNPQHNSQALEEFRRQPEESNPGLTSMNPSYTFLNPNHFESSDPERSDSEWSDSESSAEVAPSARRNLLDAFNQDAFQAATQNRRAQGRAHIALPLNEAQRRYIDTTHPELRIAVTDDGVLHITEEEFRMLSGESRHLFRRN